MLLITNNNYLLSNTIELYKKWHIFKYQNNADVSPNVNKNALNLHHVLFSNFYSALS